MKTNGKEQKNVGSVHRPKINFAPCEKLLHELKRFQQFFFFNLLWPFPGHSGEREHQPGLDVPLLSDQ